MITFTWDDLKRLLTAKRKKIVRWSLICGVLAFFIQLFLPLKYEAQATFKQSTSRMDQSFNLKNLLRTFSSGTPEGSAASLMLSDTVLEKTAGHLGLQAELKTNSSIELLLRRIGKNILAEIGFATQDKEIPLFSSLVYAEETPLHLKFIRTSEREFQLLDEDHRLLKSGQVGELLTLDKVEFTLDSLPPTIPYAKEIALNIHPLQHTAAALRKQITIKASREDKNLLQIKCRDTNHKRSAKIANALMAMYEKHLIEENKTIIGAQLSYLRQRQDELSARLDQDIQDHAQALKQNLQSKGFLGIKDEVELVLEPLQAHQLRLDELELELRQIDQRLSKTNLDTKFVHNQVKLVERYSQLLAQQISSAKDLLNQVHRKEKMTLPPFLENLQPVAQEFNQALQTLDVNLPSTEQLFQNKQQETELVLHDLLKQLTSREHSLHQGHELIQSFENDLTGISLASARSLFDHYSKNSDDLQAQLKQVVFIRDHLFDPHFEISTLSNILSDSVTQQMVQRSSELEAQLCDDLNRSLKDRDRLKITLMIHKRFLESHLEQTLQLGKIRIELIKEKISSLYNIMRTLLEQEKEVLKGKISELKQSMQTLPDLWVHENRLKFKTELTKGMMEGLVNIAETKNLSHYLYQVESKPLDKARVPLLTSHPLISATSILIATLASIVFAFLFFAQSLLRGIPVSLSTLKEIGAHTSGFLSLQSPLTLDSLEENDQETLRRLASFLMESQQTASGVVAVVGEKQTNFFPALTALLKKYHFSSCVIDCSFGKIVYKKDEMGLLQVLKGVPYNTCLQHLSSYDFLAVGGVSTESVELLKSKLFQELLKELSSRYDYLFLSSRTSIDSLESEALTGQSNFSIISAETSLEPLQKSLDPSRQKEKNHVTFIQYPILIEP